MVATFLKPILHNSQRKLLILNEPSTNKDSESAVEETSDLAHPQPVGPQPSLSELSLKEVDSENKNFKLPERIRETYSGFELPNSGGSDSGEASVTSSRSATSPPTASTSKLIAASEPIVELPASPKKRSSIFLRASKKFKQL